VGCGGEGAGKLFRANLEGGGTESFAEFVTEATGEEPVVLVTCSKDPTPQIYDDEQTLCLSLHLDGAALSAAGASATLPIQGEAKLADAVGPTPAAFTAATGHSSVVTTAWGTVNCFAPRLDGPFVQQLEGRLELEKNTAERLAGHVVLTLAGQVQVGDCGKAITSADFDFSFDVARR
jgi:hypothetical protein